VFIDVFNNELKGSLGIVVPEKSEMSIKTF